MTPTYSRIVNLVEAYNANHVQRATRQIVSDICLLHFPDITIREFRDILERLYADNFIDVY